MIWILWYLAIGFFIGVAVSINESENVTFADFLAVELMCMFLWPGIVLYWLVS